MIGPTVQPNLSPGGSIYSEYMQGKIDLSQYQKENACIVADNLHWYMAKQYTHIPDVAASYLHARLNRNSEYEPKPSEILGEWVRLVFRQKDENDANLSLILWSLSELEPQKIQSSCDQLKTAAEKFSRITFPSDLYSKALRVQILDTIETDIITRAMELCKGDCSRAARKLGMKRTTLVMRRKALGLLKPQEPSCQTTLK